MKKHIIICLGFALFLCSCAGALNNKNAGLSDVARAMASEGDKAFKTGNYKLASDFYSQAVSSNPNNKELLNSFADSLKLSGKLNEALQVYDRLISLDKSNLDAYEEKAMIFLKQARFNEATALFSEINTKDEKRWKSINGFAVAQTLSGKNEVAGQLFNAALEASPDNPVILNNMGLSKAFAKDYPAAITALKKAAEKFGADLPKKQKAEMNLALVYGISGNMLEAEKLMAKTLPRAEVYKNLSEFARLNKNDGLARMYLQKVMTGSN